MPRTDYVFPGIHVNSRRRPYARQIAAAIKAEETRTAPVLDCFIGRRVGIIETGRGRALLVGFATITGRVVYDSVCDFRQAEPRHLVPAGDVYDIKTGGVKYAYIMEDAHLLPDPLPVPASTYTGDRTARDLAPMFTSASLFQKEIGLFQAFSVSGSATACQLATDLLPSKISSDFSSFTY